MSSLAALRDGTTGDAMRVLAPITVTDGGAGCWRLPAARSYSRAAPFVVRRLLSPSGSRERCEGRGNECDKNCRTYDLPEHGNNRRKRSMRQHDRYLDLTARANTSSDTSPLWRRSLGRRWKRRAADRATPPR